MLLHFELCSPDERSGRHQDSGGICPVKVRTLESWSWAAEFPLGDWLPPLHHQWRHTRKYVNHFCPLSSHCLLGDVWAASVDGWMLKAYVSPLASPSRWYSTQTDSCTLCCTRIHTWDLFPNVFSSFPYVYMYPPPLPTSRIHPSPLHCSHTSQWTTAVPQ